ncbi:heavy metal-binding domain-containing protein [Spongiivirga citrea]|uniref:Uncharacterized protein n=1 Tax=Spongiivirga citrea TaxID=1481457 RepID=A0A6M0CR72_9FLAO|nr:heavy metal-binding domain-containing protein [Spongiivirga citrea]NER16450.1 hypothetical protein [Spongiivirga citrea]
MKLVIPFFIAALVFTSCDNKASKTVKLAETDISTEETLESSSTLAHYICSKGCGSKGGDAPGSCKVCGSELTHNQAFHNKDADNTAPKIESPSSVPLPSISNESPKNAKGIFHYTCPNGHDKGGAGAAGACSVCGVALTHNQAFHN